jgi:hypothetical protein
MRAVFPTFRFQANAGDRVFDFSLKGAQWFAFPQTYPNNTRGSLVTETVQAL